MPNDVAHATTVGGRNGHVETSDRLLKADLSIPKSTGAPARKGPAPLSCFRGRLFGLLRRLG
jgi:organic hydroperoxide reductase OsmC/OhrA